MSEVTVEGNRNSDTAPMPKRGVSIINFRVKNAKEGHTICNSCGYHIRPEWMGANGDCYLCEIKGDVIGSDIDTFFV